MKREPSELTVVLLVACVQFVNILDFMIVMPLGPDFSRALAIPQSQLGYIGGAYTAAASIAGLAGSFFLDRFDRRKALAVAMAGLVVGTALGGFAPLLAPLPPIHLLAALTGASPVLAALMAARIVAGLFGGPATSLALSIIADKVPAERRGKAMGVAMGAFSVASVLGVPAGLELARRGSWRLPFFAVAGLGAVVAAGAILLLPPLIGHLRLAGERRPGSLASLGALLSRPIVRLSYSATATTMIGGFILLPNLSAFLQSNLGFPRDRLGLLYMAGGVLSFFTTQLGGRLVDRFGAFRTSLFACIWFALVLALGFLGSHSLLSVPALFLSLMFGLGLRNVSHQTLVSRVPDPAERAQFLSLQSAVQHFASAAGAFASARMLTEREGKLVGMPAVAAASLLLTLLLPVLLGLLEAAVQRRDRVATAQAALGATPIARGGPA